MSALAPAASLPASAPVVLCCTDVVASTPLNLDGFCLTWQWQIQKIRTMRHGTLNIAHRSGIRAQVRLLPAVTTECAVMGVVLEVNGVVS